MSRHPPPQDVHAVNGRAFFRRLAFGDLRRRDDVPQRLGHLPALVVEGEAVNEDLLVGRAALKRVAGQEGGVEPAGKLVESFALEDNDGRRLRRGSLDDVVPGDSAVQPDVENVLALRQTWKATDAAITLQLRPQSKSFYSFIFSIFLETVTA